MANGRGESSKFPYATRWPIAPLAAWLFVAACGAGGAYDTVGDDGLDAAVIPLPDGVACDTATDPNPFTGRWALVEFAGLPDPDRVVWEFTAQMQLRVTSPNAELRGTYCFDPVAQPHRIALAFEDLPVNHAIYELTDAQELLLKEMNGAPGPASSFALEDGYHLLRLNLQ